MLVGFAACTHNFHLVSRLKIHCLSELLGTVEEGQTWTCPHAENICLLHNSITSVGKTDASGHLFVSDVLPVVVQPGSTTQSFAHSPAAQWDGGEN